MGYQGSDLVQEKLLLYEHQLRGAVRWKVVDAVLLLLTPGKPEDSFHSSALYHWRRGSEEFLVRTGRIVWAGNLPKHPLVHKVITGISDYETIEGEHYVRPRDFIEWAIKEAYGDLIPQAIREEVLGSAREEVRSDRENDEAVAESEISPGTERPDPSEDTEAVYQSDENGVLSLWTRVRGVNSKSATFPLKNQDGTDNKQGRFVLLLCGAWQRGGLALEQILKDLYPELLNRRDIKAGLQRVRSSLITPVRKKLAAAGMDPEILPNLGRVTARTAREKRVQFKVMSLRHEDQLPRVEGTSGVLRLDDSRLTAAEQHQKTRGE